MSTGTYNPRSLDGFVKKNRFYLKDGSNVYRVLPPFKTLRDQGIIAKYWAVYWLPTSKKAKDGKSINRPVPTILQMGRDKQIIQRDPITEKIEALRKSLDAMKENGGSQPEAVVKALEERLKTLNLDKGYYLNVITPTGDIGVLKIKYTAFQALKERLKQLEKDGIDPINVGTGVFFDFKRGMDDKGKTVYTVDIHQRTFKNPQTGRIVTEMVEAPIDQNTLDQMEKSAFDLSELYKVLSPDEQAMAATLDPAVIDRLFARPEKVDEDAGVSYEDEDEDLKTNMVAAAAAAAVSTPAPKAQAPASAPPAQAGNFDDLVKNFLSNGQA